MLLRVYSNRFLRNHTGIVVPRVFPTCWKLLGFDQIQLDAYCAVVWRRFEVTFKLRPVIPIFERNEMTECPRKPRQPASIGITWHIQPFSTQSARSQHAVSRNGFSSARVLPPGFFFSQGDSQFYVEVTLLWIGPCYNVRLLFCLHNVNWKLYRCLEIHFPVVSYWDFFVSPQDIHLPWETKL